MNYEKIIIGILITFVCVASYAANNSTNTIKAKIANHIFDQKKASFKLLKQETTITTTVEMVCSDGTKVITAVVYTTVDSDTGAVKRITYQNSGHTCPVATLN